MRRLVGTGAAASVALLSIASASHADAPKPDASPPASTPPIVYQSLPQGHLPDMPAGNHRPAAVGAGSKAPGLFVVHPHREGAAQEGATEAYLVGSQAMAKSLAQGNFAMPEDNPSCVTTSTVLDNDEDDDAHGPWRGSAESRSEVMWRSRLPGLTPAQFKEFLKANPRIQAAHMEKLARADDGKSATLDWVDAWVDPVTAGAQTIGQGALTLTRVATGPAGTEVYAARDASVVHFVFRLGDPPKDETMQSMFMRQIQVTGSDPMRRSASDCGFLRVTLPVGSKADEMAAFETRVLLPPLRPTPTPAADDKTVVQARVTAAQQPRRRLLVANVSSTQTTADADPLVSVSFGWDGKDDQD
jgi:hypothetical protein